VAGGLALDPVRGPELKVTSLLHVGRQTTESPWQNVRVYLDGHHRMVALLVEVRLA
jgi:hypothetical protein